MVFGGGTLNTLKNFSPNVLLLFFFINVDEIFFFFNNSKILYHNSVGLVNKGDFVQ